MKKIYILSELFYPNKTSTAYIMTEIALFLQKNNDVSVICSDIKYDSNYLEEKENPLQGIKLYKTKGKDGVKNSFIQRVISSFTTALAFGRKVVKHVKSSDTVLAVTNPFMLVLTLGLIRSFKKFDYILLVHDVFPENAIPAGVINKNGILYKMTKFIYDWSYSKPDKLIVLGRDMKKIVEGKIKSRKQVFVLENWFDKDLSFSHKKNNYLNLDINTERIIIGFAGNIGRVQNLETFVQLFSETSNPNLFLVIVGDGAMKGVVENLSNKLKISNIKFLGARPRNEQSDFLNSFDIGLITLEDGMYGLGVPSKTYNLLSLGKPILYIGDKGSELDLLINEDEIGWSFSWDEKDKIVKFLDGLVFVSEKTINNSRKIANERFSANVILNKLQNLISDEY